jgi:hypothetical protein
MEKKFKIYREVVINNPDGTTKILTNEIGSTTLEQLQKDLQVSIQQRDRMQELVDLTNREIELVNTAGENDYIIL